MTDNIITYCILNGVMRPDFRRKVISIALDYREKAAKEDRRDIDNAIRRFKGVKGFNNNPVKAPTNRLIEPCIKSFPKDSHLVGSLLRLWVHKNNLLEAKIIEFLKTKESIIIPTEKSPTGFGSIWPSEKMKEFADEFVGKDPEEDHDDVCLMLCYLTDQAPIPEDQMEEFQKEIEKVDMGEGSKILTDGTSEDLDEKTKEDETSEGASLSSMDTEEDKTEKLVKPDDVKNPVEESVAIKSDEVVEPLKESHELLPLPTREYLPSLSTQLQKVQGLIESAKFDDIYIWTDEFRNQVKNIQQLFDQLYVDTKSQLVKTNELISQIFESDKVPFLQTCKEIEKSLSESNYQNLYDLSERLNALGTEIQIYNNKFAAAKENLRVEGSDLKELIINAQKWGCDEKVSKLLPISVSDIFEYELQHGLPEILQLLLKLREIKSQIDNLIKSEKANFIAHQKDEIAKAVEKIRNLIPLPENNQVAEYLKSLIVGLDDPLSKDDDLLQIPQGIVSFVSQIRERDLESEIQEAAKAYLQSPEQYYFENILSGLWTAKKVKVAAPLLAAAFHGALWQKGAALPENGLQHYFSGLLAFTPEDEMVDLACSLLEDRTLTTLVQFDQPRDRLSIMFLCASLVIARPNFSTSDILWNFEDNSEEARIHTWGKLVNGLRLSHSPLIINKKDLDPVNLEKIVNSIEKEFQKEGGRYVRTAGSGNKDLLNAEQRSTLPELEKKWKILCKEEPETSEWFKISDEIMALTSADIYLRSIKSAGLSQDSNTYFRKSFEEKYGSLLELFQDYIAEKVRIQNIKSKEPILLESLQKELKEIEEFVGPSLGKVIRAGLYEAIDRNKQNEDSKDKDNRVPTIAERIAKALLWEDDLASVFPEATIWISKNSIDETDGWKPFLIELIKGFVEAKKNEELFGMFLNADLPDQSLRIAEQLGNQEGITRAIEYKNQLKASFDDIVSTLLGYNTPLSDLEMRWWNGRRYRLTLDHLTKKITSLDIEKKNQEKNQREIIKRMYEDAADVEKKLFETEEISPTTKAESFQALSAVKEVCLRNEYFRIDAAKEVLAEINHLVAYPGAGSESIHRALETLRSITENFKSNDNPSERVKTYSGDSPAVDILKALKESDWNRLQLKSDTLSDNQREERSKLLEIWMNISGLPFDITLLEKEDISNLRQFSDLFANTTQLLHGDSSKRGTVTNIFYSNPIPHFQTSFRSPRVTALGNKVVLLFVTQSTLNKRELRIIEQTILDENWLAFGYYIIFVAPLAHEILSEWSRRVFPKKPIVVINETDLLNIVLASENPSATGYLRRKLLRVSGPNRFEVFKFEEKVDEELNIFVGRSSEIRALVDSNQSHAIYGGRKIGKTSLLNAVRRELQAKGIQTVDVSIEGSEGLDVRRLEGLPIAQEILQNLKIDKACNSLSDFKTLLSSYLHDHPDIKVVILLDEVDRYIKARDDLGQPHDLIHVLRGLYQQNNGQLRFILAGFLELWRQLHGKGKIAGQETPWFNFVSHSKTLEGLDSTDAQIIVKQGFQQELGIRLATPSIPRLVVEKTTGHPAFVQKFCERLQKRAYDHESDQITEDDVQAVFEDQSDENYISFVNYTLGQNLNSLPQLIVYLLAIEKVNLFNLGNIKMRGIRFEKGLSVISDTNWKDSLDELLVTSVIKKGPTPGQFTFSVPSYPEILRQFEVTDQEVIFELIKKILTGKS